MGGEYSRGSRLCKALRANSAEIHLNLYSRLSTGDGRRASPDAARRALRRPASRPAGRGNSRSRPRPALAPAARNSRASAPLADPAHADRPADPTAAATARSCCRRDRPHRRAREPAVAGRDARLAGGRVDRARLQRVDQRDRVGPPSSAATATAAGSATLGVSFTISGFCGQRPQRLQQRLGLLRLLADDQAGVDVGAGDVELDRRDLVPLRHAPRPVARSPRGWSPSPRRSAAPAARASCGRSSARKPSRPLFGSPIELIIPAGVSQIRCGSLPARGSGVIVFETKAEKGKSLEQRVAEDPPGGDRVEGARGVDHRVRQLDPAELRHGPARPPADLGSPRERPGRRRRGACSRRRGLGTAQPKQAPKPQAIGDSIASSQATPRSAQSARTASSIGGGPQA